MGESVTASSIRSGSSGKSGPVDLAFDAAEYASRARSPATVAAYERDWNHFITWARSHGLEVLERLEADAAFTES